MNTAQIIGMRMVAEGLVNPVPVLKAKPLSAKEMALIPHKLGRDGTVATLQDGTWYVWDNRFSHWAKM